MGDLGGQNPWGERARCSTCLFLLLFCGDGWKLVILYYWSSGFQWRKKPHWALESVLACGQAACFLSSSLEPASLASPPQNPPCGPQACSLCFLTEKYYSSITSYIGIYSEFSSFSPLPSSILIPFPRPLKLIFPASLASFTNFFVTHWVY